MANLSTIPGIACVHTQQNLDSSFFVCVCVCVCVFSSEILSMLSLSLSLINNTQEKFPSSACEQNSDGSCSEKKIGPSSSYQAECFDC
jgi:hypothetical protein